VKADWVIINSCREGRFECLRCGEHYTPAYPVPIDILVAIGNAFTKKHKSCEPHPDGLMCLECHERGHVGAMCPKAHRAGMSPAAWVSGPDTGLSSKAIFYVMTGTGDGHARAQHPRDPDDFGRCYRLLQLFPQWRARLGEMSLESLAWAGLVAEWDELERLYEEERPTGKAPKLYRAMRKAYGELP
jgi:hypothetical protein